MTIAPRMLWGGNPKGGGGSACNCKGGGLGAGPRSFASSGSLPDEDRMSLSGGEGKHHPSGFRLALMVLVTILSFYIISSNFSAHCQNAVVARPLDAVHIPPPPGFHMYEPVELGTGRRLVGHPAEQSEGGRGGRQGEGGGGIEAERIGRESDRGEREERQGEREDRGGGGGDRESGGRNEEAITKTGRVVRSSRKQMHEPATVSPDRTSTRTVELLIPTPSMRPSDDRSIAVGSQSADQEPVIAPTPNDATAAGRSTTGSTIVSSNNRGPVSSGGPEAGDRGVLQMAKEGGGGEASSRRGGEGVLSQAGAGRGEEERTGFHIPITSLVARAERGGGSSFLKSSVSVSSPTYSSMAIASAISPPVASERSPIASERSPIPSKRRPIPSTRRPDPDGSPPRSWRRMGRTHRLSKADRQLLKLASAKIANESSIPTNERGKNGSAGSGGRKKIAFMFLVRGPMPLASVWERFLRGHEGYYSVYMHACPGFAYAANDSKLFSSNLIPSESTAWGSVRLIDAERRLLARALLDPDNHRFALVSESCVPIRGFRFMYSYLFREEISYVKALPEKTRYQPEMAPVVTRRMWQKGSQWLILTRRHAGTIVSDKLFYPLFASYCIGRGPRGACFSDEHYMQTVLVHLDRRRVSRWTTTYLRWGYKHAAHPVSYGAADVTEELLQKIRSDRTCKTRKGKRPVVCYLFMRKFRNDTADVLHALGDRLGIWEEEEGIETSDHDLQGSPPSLSIVQPRGATFTG
ncbi:hypothetical protein CBR_g1096 [Chara braunii]|uniref:Uncharacterized protein n=1 Tax=Chara braunii TaxID=69332 RepID=A0A388KD80_CHABU|nr:hypothetical protein CBR_g1096 [Chara braunii]|eukprot:GBG67977.1 hypothetical protein CBR_g1096 [Chara braunii]